MSARRTADETRDLIRTTALHLFRERGFDATTMRAVAQEAGVAVGNAYHHFASKDDLVQEVYLEVNREHAARARTALATGGDLTSRLRATWHAGLDAFGPYRRFGVESIGVAIRPGSAASPFSASSAPSADLSRAIFREVVDGASPAVPAHLRADLPELLWLAQLGVVVAWVHDTTPDQRRVRALVDGAAPLVGRLVGLARLPVARGVAEDALRLLRAVRP
ncbi:TetR/AcrR family transcriptional regulator [Cellulomonas iranensis]|uniref:TetR/AcrR family transcriptional regulator n=1 Tax=Cellulomonas iranensis TaxID=76862 RepID=UPI000B3CD9A3|nr:TetR family transcriptional regulator [Cellulomonas iranensis]